MAAVVYKITYKNHCTPQEYITENSRWYLDSDVGARLTGTAVMNFGATATQPGTGSVASGAVVNHGTGGYDFIYVKNTSASDGGGLNISFADEDPDGSEADGYRIYLGPGECFASKIATFACCIIRGTGTTTYEKITAT